MKKTFLTVLVVVVAVGAAVAVLAANNNKEKATVNKPASSDMNMSGANNNQSNSQNNTSQTNTQNSQQVNAVNISNFAFTPVTLKVKKGTIVTWTNQDSVKHTVTPDKADEDFKGSELLDKGGTYSVTFNDVGTYTYHCQPHPYMKGTIEVTE
jgi:amicyanin